MGSDRSAAASEDPAHSRKQGMHMGGSPDRFVIVQNHEDQYSIWPADEAVPAGWEPIDAPATRSECLDRIEARWTDMRPASLRAHMDGVDG